MEACYSELVLADGIGITMSCYVTKCSLDQVLGLRPDLRKVDKHLLKKVLKLFLHEHFNYRKASYFLVKQLLCFHMFVCSFLHLIGGA